MLNILEFTLSLSIKVQFALPAHLNTHACCIGPYECKQVLSYLLEAPGTLANAQRLLRGLQVGKPMLIEGPPGVGKTSLVTALSSASGHHLTRINLSEHTVSCTLLVMIFLSNKHQHQHQY